MGIFLDTVEDNAEDEGWRSDGIRRKYGIFPSNLQKIPSEICQICHQKFFTYSDLQNHIFDLHKDEKNTCLASDPYLEQSNEIINIDYSDINNLLFELQTKINQGKRIDDWSKYKQVLINPKEHNLRKKYLKGILDYINSHYYETTQETFVEQFERAYGDLDFFAPKVKIAQQICCSIALKMNWFEQLNNLSDYSLFSLAYHFFTQPYQVVNITIIPLIEKRQKQGIIIDDFHQELLECLQLYYCSRSNLTYTNIRKLELLI